MGEASSRKWVCLGQAVEEVKRGIGWSLHVNWCLSQSLNPGAGEAQEPDETSVIQGRGCTHPCCDLTMFQTKELEKGLWVLRGVGLNCETALLASSTPLKTC